MTRSDSTARATVLKFPKRPIWHPEPNRRGNHAVYRLGEKNFCPGCGRSQWFVGRETAECAFCETALPLIEGVMR